MRALDPAGADAGAVRRRRWLDHGLAAGLIGAAILGWWLLAAGLPEYIVPGLPSVFKSTARLFYDPNVLGHTAISVVRVIAAVVISVLLGWLLAQIPRWSPVAEVIVHERIKPFLNSFPSVGWALLGSIWFGPSHGTIIFVEVAILTPFCLVNISEGMRELDRELLEMGRSFTRSRRKVFFKITLPLLLPYLMAALRIAYGVGWKIALVAELFGTESGLGFLMERARHMTDAATVFATCFAIVALFMAGEKLIIEPLSRLVKR